MKKLIKCKQQSAEDPEYMFYCPGCGTHHFFKTTGKPAWQFTGNIISPTVRPSILVRTPVGKITKVCHLYITQGKINYLSDCTHPLAGKVVDMQDEGD